MENFKKTKTVNIRLTEGELKAIKDTARQVFSKDVRVWIFGSRVNPELKGEDIDIYIEIPNYEKSDIFKSKIKQWFGKNFKGD